MNRQIDLNADLGEGCGDDEGLMAVVTSANIACGGHTGDEASMRTVLGLAKAHGVAAGAHPSYPDRENFGRKSMKLPRKELWWAIYPQIERLCLLAWEDDMTLRHVKPHGALYHDAAADREVAEVIVEATKLALSGAANAAFSIVGPPGGELAAVAEEKGVPYLAEGFADRAYSADGTLVPRSEDGAVIKDDEARIAQALSLAKGEPVKTITGEMIDLPVQTICLHGDSPGALQSAKEIRAALENAGVSVKAVRP